MRDFIEIIGPVLLFLSPLLAIAIISQIVEKQKAKIKTGSKLKDSLLCLFITLIGLVAFCLLSFLAVLFLFSLPGAHM